MKNKIVPFFSRGTFYGVGKTEKTLLRVPVIFRPYGLWKDFTRPLKGHTHTFNYAQKPSAETKFT